MSDILEFIYNKEEETNAEFQRLNSLQKFRSFLERKLKMDTKHVRNEFFNLVSQCSKSPDRKFA